VLAMVVAGVAMAADPLAGSPPIQRFTPDIEVHPRNFSIAQDGRGIVYVGNQEGVLEFDGENWRLFRLPNEEIVRTLVAAPDGRVYVGGYDTFGFLERDAAGALRFHDLRATFAEALDGREFADIWDILVAPEGVYFRAVTDVFLWHPKGGAPRHWHHEGRFGGIAHHGGATLLQFRGEGIKRRAGDDWELLPETAPLQNLVYGLLPLPDGGLLTRGVDGDWWRLGGGKLTPATMPEGMPPSSQFENAMRLADGTLAMASRDGFVYLVAPDRRSERHFKATAGFITEIAPAPDGGFLIAAEQSVLRVPWPTAWNVIGSEHGADGSLSGIADWEGHRYLLTSSGARRAVRAPGGSLRFELVPWDVQSTFDLIGIAPGRALLARAHKLMVVDGDTPRELTAELVYPRIFRRSRLHADRIWVGTEMGLRLVTLAGGRPTLMPTHGDGEAMRITSIVESAPDEVWTGSDRDGIWRYRLAPDGSLLERKRFDAAQGLETGRLAEGWIERLADGTLVASTGAGWFRLDGERFVPFDVGNLAKLRKPREVLRLVQAPDGVLWAYGVTRILHRRGTGPWVEENVASFRRGAFSSHHFEESGRATFIGGQALLMHAGNGHSATAAAAAAASPQLQLRAVTLIHPDGRMEPQPLASTRAVRLPPGDSGIRFEFALPDFSRPGAQRYRGRLVGYEKEFSEWARSHRYTYSRLRPGTYRLEVEAMDAAGNVTRLAPYAVRSEPRWHATTGARLLLALVMLLLIWALTSVIVKWRMRVIDAQKRMLEDTVARRTSELADLNRRLEMMAHIDGLTGIPNRRRLDEYLAVVWQQCAERQRPLSLLAIDVDRFKEYNDREGHLAGDELLRQLVQRLAHVLRRAEDLLARYGGEEFLAVLPGADLPIARQLAEAMRQQIEQSGLGATVSIGVASRVPDPSASLTELVARADAALYVAKKAGRNRVEVSYTAPTPADA
jgi:diguanylate cyclase (GGDEF)-like protein